jgi:phage terminase large subunit GpA-like protein
MSETDLDRYLADPAEVFLRGWSAGCQPELALSVSEWANRVRILPDTSPEPGPYRWERTPYVREILDNLGPDSDVWQTWIMKGSQLGFTTVGENFVGYVIERTPGPMLFVQPTSDLVSEWSKTRIEPMIADAPSLRALVTEASTNRGENTIRLKRFPGGHVAMIGANSAVGFRARSIRFLYLDEIDGYPPDVGGEGDPVALGFKRTDNFKFNRKVLVTTTPTVKGASRIEKAFEETDQRYYEVPCPECGSFQVIRYANIVDFDEHGETALLQCAECRAKIDEAHKPSMLAAGRWTPTTESKRPGVRGYHLSALYSPWKTWGACVAEHKQAKRAGNEELQTWVNTVLAELWDDPGADPIDEDELAGRTEAYSARVPEGGLILTAGVDVQADRVEIEVIAWGANEESWGVEYAVLWGDTAARRTAGVWPALAEYLGRKWPAADGSQYGIAACCIDAGFRTQQVYRFARGKSARRIFAVVGRSDKGLPIISGKPYRKRSGRKERKVDLFIVGTDQASGIVHSRLTKSEGFGICHWPSDGHGYDLDYFRQLTSMQSKIRYERGVPRREWHLRKGRRNEAFDCRVYGYAALQLMPLDFERIAKLRAKRRERTAEATAPEVPQQAPIEPQPTFAQPRRQPSLRQQRKQFGLGRSRPRRW